MYRNRPFSPRALYGMQGFSDTEVVRGSLIRWAGNTAPDASCLFCTNKGAFQEAIEKRGFTVIDIVKFIDQNSSNWYIVTAIVPAAGSLEGAGTFITSAAWEIFGYVERVEVIDAAELPPSPEAPAVPARVLLPGEQPNNQAANNQNNQTNNNQPGNDPCASKSGLAWFGCVTGLDQTATQYGLGAGIGSVLVLASIVVFGLVILKK